MNLRQFDCTYFGRQGEPAGVIVGNSADRNPTAARQLQCIDRPTG